MAKCKAGKGCGGSCISVPYSCQLELSSGEADKLDKMADLLANRDAAIKTPQQAANWLEKNKDALATSGAGNWGSDKADLLVIGLEPGDGADVYHTGSNINNPIRDRLSTVPVNSVPGESSVEFVNRNPVLVTNEVKLRQELTELYGKTGELNTSAASQVVRTVRPEQTPDPEVVTIDSVLASHPKSRYMRNIDSMTAGAGLRTLGNINPNPVGLPSEAAWPMKNLPLRAGSPWQSRDKWLKYVEPRLASSLQQKIKSSGAAVTLVGGNKPIHNNLFRSLAKKEGVQVVEAPIKTISASGRNKSTTLRYFVTKSGQLVVQTNHPSAPTWSNAEKKAVNQTLRNYREAVRRAKQEGREGDAERILETMQQL